MQATLSRNETEVDYRSLAAAIITEGLAEEFPEFSEPELLERVARYWQETVKGNASSALPQQVVLDYGSRFAGTENSRFHFELRKRVR